MTTPRAPRCPRTRTILSVTWTSNGGGSWRHGPWVLERFEGDYSSAHPWILVHDDRDGEHFHGSMKSATRRVRDEAAAELARESTDP